jgi:hypothetical protein
MRVKSRWLWVSVRACSRRVRRIDELRAPLVIDDLDGYRANPVTGSVLEALIKRRIDQAKVTIITIWWSMAETLSGVAKKQDSDAIARRISEKGVVYVFQRHGQE